MIDFNFKSSEVLVIPISLHPVTKSLLFKGGFCLARLQGRGTSEGRTSTYGDTGRWKRREKKRGGRLQATNLKRRSAGGGGGGGGGGGCSSCFFFFCSFF